MAYLAIKYTKSAPHRLIPNRLHVKAFKTENERGAFLCAQDSNAWQALDPANTAAWPQRSGVYRQAGGTWHNEKSLDPSVLAHI